MQYGFVINHDTCIGCHACTTACKQENNVPVSHFRTSVKYVEIGKYPGIKRHFLVQRFNHCTDAPCVTICPVNALSKRPDGIVDIDRDACIGCRACMQACPYDALYLNDDLGAVEKCHFCAHRIDQGLSPACVNVCPVGAIVPGDLDDPNSPASRLKAQHETKARRVEQGTGPNVHYVGAHDLALEPGMIERPPMYLWSDRPARKTETWPTSLPLAKDARVVLDAGHKVEWGWPVALYLVTKNIAAGAAIVAPLLAWLGSPRFEIGVWPEIVALIFTLITTFLLVEDLKKPLHFYKLFTRPNWKSWLVKGGIVLTAFAGVSALIIVFYVGEDLGYWGRTVSSLGPLELRSEDRILGMMQQVRWLNALLGVMAAGYTFFLFKQCKGRDLWEHNLLLPSLLTGAATCGLLISSLLLTPANGASLPAAVLLGLAVSAFAAIHYRISHGRQATNNAVQAAAFARQLRIGPYLAEGFGSKLLIGGAFFAAVSLILPSAASLAWIGVPLALIGMFIIESTYVRAAQLPPLS